MRAIIGHVALACLLAIASSACEERPARPTPPPVSGTPIGLEIRGTTRVQRPGDTGQLTAVAVYPNSVKTDATSMRPAFSIPGGSTVATVAANGFWRAAGYGRATVQVACNQQFASTDITVLPDGMFLITGQVIQGSLRLPLSQAKVQVTMAGETISTTTDAAGRYWLPAAGVATLRVEATDFATQTIPMTVNADTQLDLVMDRVNNEFGGDYQLTFTASPSCSFPSNLSTRRYIARVQAPSNDVTVLLSGANFITYFGVAGFTGTRNGNQVQFQIGDDYYYSYQFMEDLGQGQYLSFFGEASGTIEPGTVSTTFSGTVAWGSPTSYTSCSASDHRLEFRR